MIALLLAGGVALAASLLGTRYLIDWLQRHRIGQPIHEDVPEGHKVKAGTPTMGGSASSSRAVVGYVVAHVRERPRRSPAPACSCMALIVGAGIVGVLDDWIKVARSATSGSASGPSRSACSSSPSASPCSRVTFTDGPHPALVHPLRLLRPRPAHGRAGSLWGVLLILGVDQRA